NLDWRVASRWRTAWRARLQRRKRDDSFYDLIHPQQQRRRDGEAEGLGGLHIDDQLELCRLLDREIGSLGAFEDAIDIGRHTPRDPCLTAAIRHQTAVFDLLGPLVYGGQPVLRDEIDDPLSVPHERGTVGDAKSGRPLGRHSAEGAVVIAVL